MIAEPEDQERWHDERHLHPHERTPRGRGKENGQGSDYNLWHNHCADSYDNLCRLEDWVMLDSEFLIYAIQQKMDQQKVKWSEQTRNEITILKRRLLENENLHRLPSLQDTQH